jgi:hypothetical protein
MNLEIGRREVSYLMLIDLQQQGTDQQGTDKGGWQAVITQRSTHFMLRCS